MIDDTGFRIFFLLHILSVIVAFAPAVIAVLPGGREGAIGTLDRAARTIYSPALILTGYGIPSAFQLQDAFTFLILVLVLIFRPGGLLGTGEAEKV